MSVQNGERLVTKQDLADFYNNILPYMGGIVTSKAGFTPIGTIISVMGTTAPVNYLVCDGTVYNINDYVELANYFNEQFGSKNFFGGDGTTTFAVPDLRGEFLRGTGTNSHDGQGSGGAVGEHQDGTVQKEVGNSNDYLWTGNSNKSVINTDNIIRTSTQIYIKGTKDPSAALVRDYTSRPTNTSVLYCIATKNFYIDPTLDYSTDEKVVGTWIDGKPIYQKTIEKNNFAMKSSSYQSFTHGIENFDNIVGFSATLTTTESNYHSSVISCNVYGKPSTIEICTCTSNWDAKAYRIWHFTIQYTKTT